MKWVILLKYRGTIAIFLPFSRLYPMILSVNSLSSLSLMPFFTEKQLSCVFLFVLNLNFFENFHDKAYIRPTNFGSFSTIIEYYTCLLLDFNPYRKKPLQSPLQSHAISWDWWHLGRVWEDKEADI